MENSLSQKLDGLQSGIDQQFDNLQSGIGHKFDNLQSGIDHKFDNLQKSISRLAQQHDHQEEGNPERECLIDTILGEHTQLQHFLQEELMQELVEALEELPAREAGGGRRKDAMEELQKHNLHLPSPDPDLVYILPVAQPTLEAPTGKATPFALHALQNFKKLVATVQAFATTSKTMAAAHVA